MIQRYLIPILPLLLLHNAAAEGLNYPNRYKPMAESVISMMDAFSSAYQKRGGGSGNSTPSSIPWSPGGMPGSSMMPMGQSSLPMAMNGAAWSQGMNPWSMGGTPWSGGQMPMGGSPWMGNPMSMTPGMQSFSPQGMPWSGQQATNPPAAQPQSGWNYRPEASPLDGSWQGRGGEILVIHNGRFRIYRGRDSYREGYLELQGERQLTMQDPTSGTKRRYEFAQREGRLALRDETANLLLYRRIEDANR